MARLPRDIEEKRLKLLGLARRRSFDSYGRVPEAYLRAATLAVEAGKRLIRALFNCNWHSAMGDRQHIMSGARLAVQELHTLVQAGDRVALGALLQRWQVEAVRQKEVEHLWQPSPFPIELGAGV